MTIKKGSKGELVKIVQNFLGILSDGDFGRKTEIAVMKFQMDNGLMADGVVGNNTWKLMQVASTDMQEKSVALPSGLVIHPAYMDKGEYSSKTSKKEYLFIHHTAGWNNPKNVIKDWNDDNRGMIGTEFVIGGQNIKTGDDEWDGEIYQAFPEGHYAWHLGKIGKQSVHTDSVGIELCNFGQLDNGKTWSGAVANINQIEKLDFPFRGFNEYHKYSDDQIKALEKLILHVADRDNIDVRDGLPRLIKKNGGKAFEFNEDAYYGRIKGLWTHTNTRKDKFDCSPQENLVYMLFKL